MFNLICKEPPTTMTNENFGNKHHQMERKKKIANNVNDHSSVEKKVSMNATKELQYICLCYSYVLFLQM